MTGFRFETLPSKGTVYRQGDREFRLVDSENYTRQDGTPSHIVTWESDCQTCGRPYRGKSGLSAKWLAVNCEYHRFRRKRA